MGLSRRDFLKAAGGAAGAVAVLNVPNFLKQTTALPSPQIMELPKQLIPRPADVSLKKSSKSIEKSIIFDRHNPRFPSLQEVGMDDAMPFTGEWDRYVTSAGAVSPYKSKLIGYPKIYTPTGVANVDDLIEFQLILDFVSRRRVYHCLDTIELYFDTTKQRLQRADTLQDNSTPFGHPTDRHFITQIFKSKLLYGKEVEEKVHPTVSCWEVGDYIHTWQEIPSNRSYCRNMEGFDVISFYGTSPNDPKHEHWISAISLRDKKYRNPNKLAEIPTVFWMGHLPERVQDRNEPYIPGNWNEPLRGLYTPPWTPLGQGDDKRAYASMIEV